MLDEKVDGPILSRNQTLFNLASQVDEYVVEQILTILHPAEDEYMNATIGRKEAQVKYGNVKGAIIEESSRKGAKTKLMKFEYSLMFLSVILRCGLHFRQDRSWFNITRLEKMMSGNHGAVSCES